MIPKKSAEVRVEKNVHIHAAIGADGHVSFHSAQGNTFGLTYADLSSMTITEFELVYEAMGAVLAEYRKEYGPKINYRGDALVDR